jgi:hypothetical protein
MTPPKRPDVTQNPLFSCVSMFVCTYRTMWVCKYERTYVPPYTRRHSFQRLKKHHTPTIREPYASVCLCNDQRVI